MKTLTLIALAACLLVLTSLNGVAAVDCDRACLSSLATRYIDSLVAHDPRTLPLSARVRFTEDTVEKKPGEGLWTSASKPGPYRLDVLDVVQGTAVVYTTLDERGSTVLHVARLKVVDGQLTEIETMVVRSQADGGGIFDVAPLRHASDTMLRVPDRAQIPSRAEAVRIAEHYPAGLRAGSFMSVNAPFAPGAYRFENGRLMAGPACTFAAGCGDIKAQKIRAYPATYRVIAFDDTLGIVVLRQNFGPRPNNNQLDLHTWHAFKIYGGQIHAVEAFQKVLPTGTKSGWD
jgi:hypothetical protein